MLLIESTVTLHQFYTSDSASFFGKRQINSWKNCRTIVIQLLKYTLRKMSSVDKEKDTKEETNQKSEDLGLLEEDDEFEEFPAEDFRVADDVEEPNVWEDNWDDDNVEDDFSQQLKAHLESKKMET